MREISAALAAHLRGDATTTAICWHVELGNGDAIRGTEHDRDIQLDSDGSPTLGLTGRYYSRANISGADVRSASDMSVDNTEVEGAFAVAGAAQVDVTVAQIEAGLLDHAPVHIFLVNWQRPNDGLYVIRRGWLGNLSRDSDGRYTAELRGLAQALSQNIGQTASERCNVREFGDSRCGIDAAALTQSATVTVAANRRTFTASFGGPAPSVSTYYDGGKVAFTSGANATFYREAKRVTVAGGAISVTTWEEFPEDIAPGDTLSVTPGCDRRLTTCRDVFANLNNFRGYGVFAPGRDELIRGPI